LGQCYLFTLRQSAGVKRLIERQWSRCDWQVVGQGCEAVEATLQLSGWGRRGGWWSCAGASKIACWPR